MNSLTILFETHATSLDNEAGLASGWYDVDLSAAGRLQALAMGERHREAQVSAVYCSDLQRSWRTADLAFGGRWPVIRDPRLRECDYGELTRARADEIDHQRGARVSVPFPGGESYEQVTARVRGWLLEVRRATRAGRLFVIGHRATYYALEHLLGGRPLGAVVESPWAWQPGWIYQARRTGRSA